MIGQLFIFYKSSLIETRSIRLLTIVKVEQETTHVFVVNFSSAVGFVLRDNLRKETRVEAYKLRILPRQTIKGLDFANSGWKKPVNVATAVGKMKHVDK